LGTGKASLWHVLQAVWALTFTVAAQAGTINSHVTTAAGDPLMAAVVTVTPMGQTTIQAKPGTKAVMVQEGKQFVPFVLPVQVGTTVEFPNHDPFRHQVYSFSPAKTFELKLYGGSVVSTVVFDKEGIVPLGCNIHDNMLAYIYVVGTPYFSATDQGGEGKVTQLPPGTYTVKAWHPNQKAGQDETRTVEVTATSNTDISIKVDLKHGRTQRKPGAADETYN
jgi:plastocyanin